jgi:hypothetical protein
VEHVIDALGLRKSKDAIIGEFPAAAAAAAAAAHTLQCVEQFIITLDLRKSNGTEHSSFRLSLPQVASFSVASVVVSASACPLATSC